MITLESNKGATKNKKKQSTVLHQKRKDLSEKDKAALYYVTKTNQNKINEKTFTDKEEYESFKSSLGDGKNVADLISYRMLDYIEDKVEINSIFEQVNEFHLH